MSLCEFVTERNVRPKRCLCVSILLKGMLKGQSRRSLPLEVECIVAVVFGNEVFCRVLILVCVLVKNADCDVP